MYLIALMCAHFWLSCHPSQVHSNKFAVELLLLGKKPCPRTHTNKLVKECRPSLAIDTPDVQIAEQLGSGGFSVVYRGTWLGTPVAIKKWFDSNATTQQRTEIRQEVMTLAV
jgi:hypothetical protein